MAEEEDVNAIGDVIPEPKPETPEPPKVPDVQLTVDGFGFMPNQPTEPRRFSTQPTEPRRYSRQHGLSGGLKHSTKSIDSASVDPESPCSSSTNINIVRRYTWTTKNRMIAQVITYGATITSIKVPDRKGVPDDVVGGYETLEEYMQKRNPYMGATLGRYANIIRDGTIVIPPSGRMFMLSTNHGRHHINGGYVGFDRVNWRSYVTGNKVIMCHVSERLHEGYPGTLMAQVSFEVTCDNTLHIEMRCTTTEPTVVNMSNCLYFNMAGHHAGQDKIFEHIITVNADKYTVADENGVVTGEKKVVGGTILDFRVPRMLKTVLPKVPLGGIDMNYCITQGTEQALTFHARALDPYSGRVLEVYSSAPGLQFYTGNKLPDPDKIIKTFPMGEEASVKSESSKAEDGEEEEFGEEGSVISEGYVPLGGKSGTYYKKHGLFCMMPQNWPDAVNNRHFPSPVLNPGEVYHHNMQYKFGILLGKYL